MRVAVHRAELRAGTAERLGRRDVLGRERLAVAAPRRVELHQPEGGRVLHHDLVEIAGGQDTNVAALGVQRRRGGGRERHERERHERDQREGADAKHRDEVRDGEPRARI